MVRKVTGAAVAEGQAQESTGTVAPPSAVPKRHTQPVRSRRKDLNAAEQKIGQARTRHMKSRGPAREALEAEHIDPVERPVSDEKVELLRFNEDELVVIVHESTNPTDEPFPEVWNDGICQRFQRGKEQTVKRKYVEVLARAKLTTRSNEKYKDGNGDDAYRYPGHTALRYPFSVLHDPSPKGRDWLKSVLQEG